MFLLLSARCLAADVLDGAVTPVRKPGALGVRLRLAPAQVPAAARLEVISASGVVHQVLDAAALARRVTVPEVPPGALEGDRFLDGDTILLRLSGAGGASIGVAAIEEAAGPSWAGALAARWAPHIFQDTDKAGWRYDLIAAFDFDGNLNGDDNWEHARSIPDYPLGGRAENQAAVYWFAAESSTHAFVGYAFFHPRDWDHLPWFNRPDREHVNDMEGMLLAVRKEGEKPELMQTINHRNYLQYALDPKAWGMRDAKTGAPTKDAKKAREVLEAPLTVRDGHPAVYIEAQGHGVTGRPREHWMRGPNYDGVNGDGVHYKPGAYALKSIAPLWHMAHDPQFVGPGRTFHDLTRFQGDSHGGKHAANPPWGWNHTALAPNNYPGGAGTLFTDPGGLIAWQFVPPAPFDPVLVRRSWD